MRRNLKGGQGTAWTVEPGKKEKEKYRTEKHKNRHKL
jgi:hypothetical protein